MVKGFTYQSLLILISASLFVNFAGAHQHHKTAKQAINSQVQCNKIDIRCAKAVTSAFAPNGELWRLWSQQEQMFFQISQDKGQGFAPAKQVNIPPEKISARNENRPKIAFDNAGNIYLSWAMPREKKYTADIRLSYSRDNGKTFSPPVTINNDNLLTSHSFNELNVSSEGKVSIVWLDGRLKYQLQQQGKNSNGSALYLAQAELTSSSDRLAFTNQQLANNTCVCCRIAIDSNKKGDLAIFWRHIYGDNIREFALLTITEKSSAITPRQVSHDHWKINGCPHQGGGISIDNNNRYHMVWFNQGSKGKGIFYAFSDDQGQSKSLPIKIGNSHQQAAHPHVLSNNNIVDVVWLEFNGKVHQLWHQRSTDFGQSFTTARQISHANNGADRPFLIKLGQTNYVSWQRPQQGHSIHPL